MAETKIVGYKKIFGLILPDWVGERMIKSFVVGLLALGVMLLVFILVIRPKFEDIKKLQATVILDSAELTNLRKSLKGIDGFEESLKPEVQRKVLAAIPTSYSPDRAVFVLRSIASFVGASVLSYSLPPGVILDTNLVELDGKQGEMVSFLPYSIKIVVAAPVDILLKFITKVENSLPYGVVSDLNLQEVTKLTKGDINRNVQVSLEIRYYQAKLNKININKIAVLTDSNLQFSDRISELEEVLGDTSVVGTTDDYVGTPSGDMFGIGY